MYKAIEYFTDLQDDNYIYKVDDIYPREGYEPTEERIKQLSSSDNARGRAVIKAIETAKEEPVEATEKEPVEEEKPKRTRKKREE